MAGIFPNHVEGEIRIDTSLFDVGSRLALWRPASLVSGNEASGTLHVEGMLGRGGNDLGSDWIGDGIVCA